MHFETVGNATSYLSKCKYCAYAWCGKLSKAGITQVPLDWILLLSRNAWQEVGCF